MKQLRPTKFSAVAPPLTSMERRSAPRASVCFALMYSGLSKDGLLIGDGTVVDLSKGGLSIRGDHPVKVGMELTIFFYLPSGDDPLFIVETNVAWTAGSLFGVEFKKLSLREGNRLQAFLRSQSALPDVA